MYSISRPEQRRTCLLRAALVAVREMSLSFRVTSPELREPGSFQRRPDIHATNQTEPQPNTKRETRERKT